MRSGFLEGTASEGGRPRGHRCWDSEGAVDTSTQLS